MSKILQNVSKDFYNLYMDDCVIYSNSFKEHIEHVRVVLKALEDGGMKVNLQKSKIFKQKIEYLGFELRLHKGGYGISPRTMKIEALIDAGLHEMPKVIRLGIPDMFAKNYGSQDNLLDSWSLDPNSMANLVQEARGV